MLLPYASHSLVCLYVYVFVGLFVCLTAFIWFFWYLISFPAELSLFVCLGVASRWAFLLSFDCFVAFVRSFVRSFVCLFVCSFVCLFVCLLVCSKYNSFH